MVLDQVEDVHVLLDCILLIVKQVCFQNQFKKSISENQSFQELVSPRLTPSLTSRLSHSLLLSTLEHRWHTIWAWSLKIFQHWWRITKVKESFFRASSSPSTDIQVSFKHSFGWKLQISESVYFMETSAFTTSDAMIDYLHSVTIAPSSDDQPLLDAIANSQSTWVLDIFNNWRSSINLNDIK